MNPEVGTRWRRRPKLPKSNRVRFDRCIVVPSKMGKAGAEYVFVCWLGAPPANYPLWPPDDPMAFTREAFFKEYEPQQHRLF